MSILQEYENIRKEIGEEKYSAIEKYLNSHKDILLNDVYYTREGWEAFEDWYRKEVSNMNNLHVKNGRYTLHGRLIFDTVNGELTLTPQDAIEIATTLFDWAGMSYDPIEQIEEKIEGGEL